MGFSMICNNRGYCCSYSTWTDIRIEIIQKTIIYLHEKIAEYQKELDEKIDSYREEDEYINGYPTVNFHLLIEELNKFINHFKKYRCENEMDRIMLLNSILKMIVNVTSKDTLVYFEVYGLYLLCNQGDFDGCYSIGESYDILRLLRLIKPYFDPDAYLYKCIYIENECSSSVYDVFQDSISSAKLIRIT